MRSLLIIPGADPAAIAAAFASGADAVLLDAAAAALAPRGGAALYLRLPALDDPAAPAALDAVGGACSVALACESGADVQRLGARLAVREAQLGLAEGALRIIAFAAESPQALFRLSSFSGASTRLEALVWSAAPFEAALRAAPTRRLAADGPVQLARNLTLIAARAAGVAALEGPCAGDLDALVAEAERARDDGFDGKLARHAAEIPILNRIFALKP